MDIQAPEISSAFKGGASPTNLKIARKAVAVALYYAWTLEGPYAGSDTRSLWCCLLPGCPHRVTHGKPWVGEKFYSHIRGRKGKDGIRKASPRHKGCLPPSEREAALSEWRKRNGLNRKWLEEHDLSDFL